MKRSQINNAFHEASSCFSRNGWALPPMPRWDITDFGLGRFDEEGLVLVNLAEEPEYCEKLMYARPHQKTPLHTHAKKKEDIICRHGRLALELWADHPARTARRLEFPLKVCGFVRAFPSGDILELSAGERVTLTPGIYHAFWPVSADTIIGEVSTANDDANDNIFVNPDIGRFPHIEEDEPAAIKLIGEL